MTDNVICAICGGTLDMGVCTSCRGWACAKCHKPAYHDESVSYDALGKRHARCNGTAAPRPYWTHIQYPISIIPRTQELVTKCLTTSPSN